MANLEQTDAMPTSTDHAHPSLKLFSDAYSNGLANTVKEHPVESVVTSSAVGAAVAGAAVLYLTRGRGLLPLAEREAGAMLQTGVRSGEELAFGAARPLPYTGSAIKAVPGKMSVDMSAAPMENLNSSLLKRIREATAATGPRTEKIVVDPKVVDLNRPVILGPSDSRLLEDLRNATALARPPKPLVPMDGPAKIRAN